MPRTAGGVVATVSAPPVVPAAGTHAPAPLAAEARRSALEDLVAPARIAAIGWDPSATGVVAGLPAPGARSVARLTTTPRRRGPLVLPRAHAVRGGGGARLRTVRRARVSWARLPRERLTAAWGRIQTEHGAGGELLLVGVFGPVPIDAITAVALEPDGRLAMTFARRGVLGRMGDVALARHAASGRLVRCDIPHPARG